MSSKKEATATKDEFKPALVPKLRFPEFQNAGEWEEKTMGSIASFSSGGTPSKDNPKYWNGTIPWVSASSMYDQVVEKADHYVTPLAIGSGTRIAKKGSILILVRGSMLFKRVPICVAGIDVAFNQDVKALDVDAFINTGFLLYQLSAFQSRIPINETGIGAGKIELDHLKEFQLFIPNTSEQQKIVECLSSVDELIAAQARKVDALKTHKKGLMQQLFPREGETQPRLRFPEFQNAGEWEETRLGRLGELVSGLTYSPDDVRESGLLVLRSSNVQQSEIALDDCVYVDPSIKGANLSQANDILICVRNGSKALIGKCALIPEGMPLCTHGAFMTVFRAKTPSFVFQLFQSDRYQKQVAGDLGATINSINGGQLLRYEFSVPKPPEQQRIATCLSRLDALITAESQKLEALKTHKKGLMQQLFPSLEEFEGRC